MAGVLRLEHTPVSLGGLVKGLIAASTIKVSDSVGLRCKNAEFAFLQVMLTLLDQG